jgi:hypothetical protein
MAMCVSGRSGGAQLSGADDGPDRHFQMLSTFSIL